MDDHERTELRHALNRGLRDLGLASLTEQETEMLNNWLTTSQDTEDTTCVFYRTAGEPMLRVSVTLTPTLGGESYIVTFKNFRADEEYRFTNRMFLILHWFHSSSIEDESDHDDS